MSLKNRQQNNKMILQETVNDVITYILFKKLNSSEYNSAHQSHSNSSQRVALLVGLTDSHLTAKSIVYTAEKELKELKEYVKMCNPNTGWDG